MQPVDLAHSVQYLQYDKCKGDTCKNVCSVGLMGCGTLEAQADVRSQPPVFLWHEWGVASGKISGPSEPCV